MTIREMIEKLEQNAEDHGTADLQVTVAGLDGPKTITRLIVSSDPDGASTLLIITGKSA